MRAAQTSALLLALSLVIFGCDPQSSAPAPSTATASLTQDKAASLSTMQSMMLAKERLLAVSDDGALFFGGSQPIILNADPPRVFEPRYLPSGEKQAQPLPDGLGLVEDVRFFPGEQTVLLVTEDHRLLQWRDKSLSTLDEGAYGPISVSPSGRYITYLKGLEPNFEVVLYDRQNQKTLATPSGDQIGCWAPAVGDDGQVVFMSSTTGYGELYLAKLGEPPALLTQREKGQQLATPTGPSAPLLKGQTLFFEDDQGLHRIELTQEKLASELIAPQARELVWSVDGQRAWSQLDGTLSALSLDKQGDAN